MTVGLGAGIGFACNMDDVIYFQMKKNVMLPLAMASVRRQNNELSLDDIKDIGTGTGEFLASFKPKAVGLGGDARLLMVNDGNYSTANDHYFSYMQQRTGQDEVQRQREILSDLSQHGDNLTELVHKPLTD